MVCVLWPARRRANLAGLVSREQGQGRRRNTLSERKQTALSISRRIKMIAHQPGQQSGWTGLNMTRLSSAHVESS